MKRGVFVFISCNKEHVSEIKEIIQTVFDKNDFDSYIWENPGRIAFDEIGWFSLRTEIEEVSTILQGMLSEIFERFPNVQVEGIVSIGDKNYRVPYSVQTTPEGLTVTELADLNGIPASECWFPFWLNGNYGLYLAGFATKDECGTFFRLLKEHVKTFLDEKEVSLETFINSEMLEKYFEENDEAYEELCDLCEEEGIESPYTPWMGEFKDFCITAWNKYKEENSVVKENNGLPLEDCTDKAFVITGKLKLFENRDEFVEYIEGLGGKVVGSISSKTDFLICNDASSTSSKMKKAKELGIPVITEEEFIQRFGDTEDFDLDEEDEEDD